MNYFKAQRLSWFGHLHRISEDRIVKKSVQVEIDVKKITRETKEQMGNDIRNDTKKLKIKN